MFRSNWSDWSGCYNNCQKTRFRLCNAPYPRCGGKTCSATNNSQLASLNLDGKILREEFQTIKCFNECNFFIY